MKIEIDLEEVAEQVRAGKSVTSKGGVLNDLLKQLTEMTLQAEIDSHLAEDLEKNRKNGYSRYLAKLGNDDFSLVIFGCKHADSKEFCKNSSEKTMRTKHGEFQLKTQRDRNGSFEPQIKIECFKPTQPKKP